MPSDPQFRPKPPRKRKASSATDNRDSFSKKVESHNEPVKSLSTWSKIKILIQIRNLINQTKTMTSWKSKVGGALVAIAPMLHGFLPDSWQWVSGAFLTIGGLLLAGGRDNNVSSEDAKAK